MNAVMGGSPCAGGPAGGVRRRWRRREHHGPDPSQDASASTGIGCEFDDDESGTIKLELVDAAYQLKVYAATTGELQHEQTLGAKDTKCPFVATFRKGDTTFVHQPSDDDYIAALRRRPRRSRRRRPPAQPASAGCVRGTMVSRARTPNPIAAPATSTPLTARPHPIDVASAMAPRSGGPTTKPMSPALR